MSLGGRLMAIVSASALVLMSPLPSQADPLRTTVFDVPAASTPLGISFGPDGNVWFSEYSLGKVARMTTSGSITEFDVPSGNRSGPAPITSGPDGNLWFGEYIVGKIGRITPSGTISEFPLPDPGSQVTSIVAGSDGNLWFTEWSGNRIGRITPSGDITEFPVPTASSGPWSIVAGPNGNLWFTESSANKVGLITPSGSITEFAVPVSSPQGITRGPNNTLWFVGGGVVAQINGTGKVTTYAVPGSPDLHAITSASDGNLWFTTSTDKVGRVTPTGSVSMFAAPDTGYRYFMAPGPDGNVWYTNFTTDKVVRLVPPTSDLGVTLVAGSATVHQNDTLTFTATVTNAGPDDATPVKVVQSLPSPSSFVDATASQGSCIAQPTGSVTCTLGAIPSGGQATITVRVNVVAAPGQTVHSTATVRSDGMDPNGGNNSSSVDTPVAPRSSDLGVTLVAGSATVHQNDTLTFTATVTNAGPDDATPVKVVQSLPSPSSFVDATASQGSCIAQPTGSVTCTLGAMPTGASATITVRVNVLAAPGQTVHSTATVSADGSDPNPGNNSSSVDTQVTPRSSDLGVGLTDRPDPVQRNKNVTYTVTVSNAGPDLAEAIRSVQQLPAASRFVSANPSQGTCTTPAAGSSGAVVCSLGNLASGATARVTVVVTMTTKGSAQSTVNVTSNGSDPNPGNNSASASTKVCNAIILGLCL